MNNLFKHQSFQLFKALFFETTREPAVLFWGIIFPILMAVGLGAAFTKKADVTRKVAIIEHPKNLNQNNPVATDRFLTQFATAIESSRADSFTYQLSIPDKKLGNTTFLFEKTSWDHALVLLKRGTINVILKDSSDQLTYHFDPSNPDAQLTYLKLSGVINGNIVIESANNSNVDPLTGIGTRYIDFLIPGLIAMGIMMSCMWGISYGIIEKRDKKLLRRLVATPMKKRYFLMALIGVRVLMNLIEGLLLFVFAYFAFHIRIQGSLTALVMVFVAGNLAFAGIAVLLSSRTAKSEVGNGLINAIVTPMMVLSGVFFSYHNFPDWSIPIIQKFPLTIMADDMRSIFIEGAGFMDVALHTFWMALTGLLFFAIGLKIFKWH